MDDGLEGIKVGDKLTKWHGGTVEGFETVTRVLKQYFETPTGKWGFHGHERRYRYSSAVRGRYKPEHEDRLKSQNVECERVKLTFEFADRNVWKFRDLEFLKKIETLLAEDDAKHIKEEGAS